MEYEAGEYGISVSTEIALEKLKLAIDTNEFRGEQLLISVRTLVRNAMCVMTPTSVTPANVTALVLSDLELIRQYVARYSKPIELAFYYCNYRRLKSQPVVKLKTKFTEKQSVINDMIDTVSKSLSETIKDITTVDTRLDQWRKDAVIITHMPVDLLSFNEFPNLRLIESHTGVIKGREVFHTKLRRDSKVAMPFNVFTLNMYGDKAMHFEGQPIKVRNMFNKMAAKYNWTAVTSLRYMVDNIEKDTSINQFDRDLIIELSKVRY